MGKSKCEVYAPLELLKRAAVIFPECWKQMDRFHLQNGCEGYPAWPTWCYVPISFALDVATSGAIVSNIEEIMPAMSAAQIIAALAPWRVEKEVFVMDPDMELLLYKQADDIDIPTDTLMNIPYPCFYVQTSALFYASQKVEGFFVHLEFNPSDSRRELRLLFVLEDRSVIGFPLHITDADIRTSILCTVQESNDDEALALLLRESLQLILYLCSENAEIKKNPEQDTFMRRFSTVIHDRYSEIRKWDVGVRAGQAVRRYKRARISAIKDPCRPIASHSSMNPPVLRGRWQNHRMQTAEGELKLVIRWSAPTFIS